MTTGHPATRRGEAGSETGHPQTAPPNAERPTTVGDVMTTGVVVAHIGAQYKHIVESLARNRISCAPVVGDDRRVLGMISESDLLAHLAGTQRSVAPSKPTHRPGLVGSATAWLRRTFRLPPGRPVTAAELMSAPAITVRPEDSLAGAAHRALTANVHRMPVVDSTGVLVGIVSRADLLRAYLRPDAEIADEIEHRVIAERMALDPATVRVEVQAGVARLTGQVEWPGIADGLLAEVCAVPGVVSVQNDLTYKADS